jgi:protein-L-isoaspartate(D-aspartate) O-methyltransferase
MQQAMTDYAAARRNMVESQLRPNEIVDEALLAAMGELPREQFFPARLRGVAYVDEDVPIGGGRFMMEPLVLARLIQLAAPGERDKALDIGCGTGYGAAILARLCHNVIGLECDAGLAREAAARLRDLGIRNAWIQQGELTRGFPDRAPYDVVLLSGAVEEIPKAITEQLAEGGRLAAVVRPPGQVGRAVLMTRRGGIVSARDAYDSATLPLPGFDRPRAFAF